MSTFRHVDFTATLLTVICAY